MTAEWNAGLVAFSVIVAILGSFTALIHAERMRLSAGRAAIAWMTVGGATLGLSIWAMHFIGMLAYHLPIAVHYELPLTVLSLAPAVCSAMLGFHLLRGQRLGLAKVLAGGLVMGLGIASMHFLGMAAIPMQPPIEHNPWVVALAIGIAIVVSIAALLILQRSQGRHVQGLLTQVASATVMGLGIAGMHYTAMQDLHIAADSVCRTSALDVPTPFLVMAVGGALWCCW